MDLSGLSYTDLNWLVSRSPIERLRIVAAASSVSHETKQSCNILSLLICNFHIYVPPYAEKHSPQHFCCAHCQWLLFYCSLNCLLSHNILAPLLHDVSKNSSSLFSLMTESSNLFSFALDQFVLQHNYWILALNLIWLSSPIWFAADFNTLWVFSNTPTRFTITLANKFFVKVQIYKGSLVLSDVV